jgi:alkylation response protein AidB-like acyl-CoA dehydrogenase
VQPVSSRPSIECGGGFLLGDTSPADVFTPEDLTAEHRAIARTTEEFWRREVAPNLDGILSHAPGVAQSVLRKAAELGLAAVMVPEKFGGMEMDLASAMVVAEGIAKDGSYASWQGAHSGIGTLPILLFGTEEQKARYLPKLASAEWIGAYCLSEPQAGSDALAARTRADLNADGTHYVLNGQKMWITNGGAADVYTVFAKVNGEQFTAFIVERSWAGVKPGAEEKKMGVKGASTTPVYFDHVRVPVGNVLGEIGRGHVIAFNILNLGRLKLGASTVGGAREVLAQAVRYAKERVAFGKPIASFGLIQQKIAQMAIRIHAVESMTWRVVGLIERRLTEFSWDEPDAARRMLKAVEEYAIECSMVKVYGSEMLDFVVDEGVQIHGGYGYHQGYLVERAYRDSRVNRIFEGTNEINRLLITGMLLKRAQRGQLALVDAVKELRFDGEYPSERARMISNAKKVVLLLFGAGYERYKGTLEQQQEIVAGIADVAIYAYAMESVYLRSEKSGESDIADVMLWDSMQSIDGVARTVIAACAEGDELRSQVASLRRLTDMAPLDAIAARRRIAGRCLLR